MAYAASVHNNLDSLLLIFFIISLIFSQIVLISTSASKSSNAETYFRPQHKEINYNKRHSVVLSPQANFTD
jgi:hypothetical protein